MIQLRQHEEGEATSIQALFTSVFTESESASEGALIGKLAKDLIGQSNRNTVYCFVAEEGARIVGAIFFSRLTFESKIQVFLLAPVAVHTQFQGKGIGQMLINHGLRRLKESGVQGVITYGDPAFYSKVGFTPLSQEVIRAPFILSQPNGWLGQSLVGDAVEPVPGPCSCVEALNNPAYW